MQKLNIEGIAKKIKNKRLLVGVSGGVDSMVLLTLLLDLQKNVDFYMEVIHINHNLRGKESDSDEKLVVSYAKQNNVPCIVKSVDVINNKKVSKQTIEESARELRYNAFYDYKKEKKFDFIVIAHNSDDQAETVLMHICRGSGLKGASGIQETDELIRPLLNVSRAEIVDFALKNKVPFREDSSNADTKYARNFIRHKILPDIENVYLGVKQNLVKFAEIASRDNDFITSMIDWSVIKTEKKLIKVNSNIFDMHEAISTRIIYKIITMLGVFADIEQKHIELIKELSLLKNGNYICLPHNLYVYKEYENLVFSVGKNIAKLDKYQKYELGKIDFANLCIEISEVDSDNVNFGDGSLYFDLDSIPNTAVFRTRNDGDVFHKLGSGTKKFSDYLTDKKVPLRVRDNLIVLASENKVLLAIGFDISDDIKITSTTNRIGKLVCTRK